jgi:thiol-disulfide isomerase/thioredoxin
MPSRSGTVFLLAAALTASACDRQTPAPEQADVATPEEVSADEVTASTPTPAAVAGTVDRSHKGEVARSVKFLDPQGETVSLAKFKGKPVLVNLWATWCAPCIKEMPSLDAAAAMANGKVHVLAVSQDMQREKVAPFFAARKLGHLAPYADPDLGLSIAYKANLPTTIMLDAEGRELWRVSGAMDWAGTDAQALIAEASPST